MATLTVGAAPGDYATLGAAVAAAQNGDTVALPAGVYTDQAASVSTDITIQGVGGTAYLTASQPMANAQGFLVVQAPGTVTVNNVSFSGAVTSNANGANAAGIRYYSGNLVLNHDSFWGNQDGILATPYPTTGVGSLTINNSTVTNNGVTNPALSAGYGYTHNLYIGNIADFTLTGSTVTAANVGHEVKSRALNTTITNNLIADGPTGTASYSIDTPNGGVTIITGNTIQQGPQSQNNAIISNGEEGASNPGALTVSGNTIINNEPNGAGVAVVNASSTPASVSGNLVSGLTSGQIDRSAAGDTVSANTLTSTAPVIGMRVGVDGTVLTSGSATANTLSAATAGPGFSALSAIGTPGLSLAITATGAAGHVAQFVLSQAGMTGAQAVASFFDTNTGLAGAVVTWSVYADGGNTPFATTTLLGSQSFVDPGGGLLVSASQGFAVPFNADTYALTEVVTIAGGAPVPEPMAFVLLAAAVAGVAMARRRRRARHTQPRGVALPS